jgi:hypothetical protein
VRGMLDVMLVISERATALSCFSNSRARRNIFGYLRTIPCPTVRENCGLAIRSPGASTTPMTMTMLGRALPSRLSLRHANCHPQPLSHPHRHISLFRRRPLYKPTNAFGRTYLRFRNFTLGIVTIGVATFSIFYLLDARSAAHRYVLTPALRLLTSDPEDAHRIAVLALKYGLHPKDSKPDDPRLAVDVSSFNAKIN